MIQFNCPECGSALEFLQSKAGTRQTCPHCGKSVSVPDGADSLSESADGSEQQSSGIGTVARTLGICSFIPVLGLISGLVAMIVGLIALAKGKGRLAAPGVVTALVGLVVHLLVISLVVPTPCKIRELGKRAICKTRLKGFGMGFELYAESHGGHYPYNTGRGSTRRQPTALNNLALLVLEGKQRSQWFVCPSVWEDELTGQPLRVQQDEQGATLIVNEDGDPDGKNRISYSYQAAMFYDGAYQGNGVPSDSSGDLPIMADRTPGPACEVDWSGDISESVRSGAISQNHRGELFNILYRDGHVGESSRGDAGIVNADGSADNIYTVGDTEKGSPAGKYDHDGKGHKYANDSVLISNDGN